MSAGYRIAAAIAVATLFNFAPSFAVIDMGSVLIGTSADTTVTVTNDGNTTVAGPVFVTGNNYTLVGPGSVDLAPSESANVTVRFAPVDVENPLGTLTTPAGTVEFTGIGYFPACDGRWNIGTFRAANLDTTVETNHALWCGVPGGTPGYEFAPGYGNSWQEVLYWSAPVPYSNVPTEVRLSFVYNADMIGLDSLRVQYYRLGHTVDLDVGIDGSTKDSTGTFNEPGVFDVTWTVDPVDYIDIGAGQKGIAILLEIRTDSNYSDELFFDSDGAIQIDNMAVRFNDSIVSHADFEPDGSDGGWCGGLSFPEPDPSVNWSTVFGEPPAGQGLNERAMSLIEYNGKLIVGGTFTRAGPLAVNRIGAWDGSQWSALGSGIGGNGEIWGGVHALAEYDGDLFAAGDFDSTGGGDPALNLARWDGTSWHGMTPPAGDATIVAIHAHDNLLYVGTEDDYPSRYYLTWWDGTQWSSSATEPPGRIYDFRTYQNKLYVGGGNYLLWWDGASFQGPGAVFDGGFVFSLGEHDGLLYVGGNWNIPSLPDFSHGIAAWDGTNWVPTEWIDYPLSTRAIGSLHDRLILAGDYGLTSFDGDTEVYMERGYLWDVYDMALYQGDLYLTGNFYLVGEWGNPIDSYYIAAWSDPVVGIDDDDSHAPARSLRVRNYPNPFNPTTKIVIQLPRPARVEVRIYDVRGRRVRTFERHNRSAGFFEMTWDGTNDAGNRVGSGIYFTRVRAGSQVATCKLVLLK